MVKAPLGSFYCYTLQMLAFYALHCWATTSHCWATTSHCWATRLLYLVAHWATTFQSNLASPARAIPERQMKETLYTRHRNTVEPMMVKHDRKTTLQALHTDAVDKAVKRHKRNVVLDGQPLPISSSERDLTRKERQLSLN